MSEDKYNVFGDIDANVALMDSAINETIKAGVDARAETKRKTTVVTIIVVAVIVAIVIAAISIIVPMSHSKKYDDAMNAYNNHQYKDAAVLFESLGDYEDSAKLLKECKYNVGTNYMADGKYEKAVAELKDIGKYKDSKKQLKECYYNLGKQAFDEGNYKTAAKYFGKTSDYKDSWELHDIAVDKVWHQRYADRLDGMSFSGEDGPTHSMEISFSGNKYKQHDHHHSLITGEDYDEYSTGKWNVMEGGNSGGYLDLENSTGVYVYFDGNSVDHIVYDGAGISVPLY